MNHSITLCTEGTICRNRYSAYVFPANEGTNITLATVTNPTVSPLVPPFAEADADVHMHYVAFSHMADTYDGFYVALRSEDACVYAHRLQVFYWTCPGGLQGLAVVDGTAEPLESRTFRCIVTQDSAQQVIDLSVLWIAVVRRNTPSGDCQVVVRH